MINPIPLTPGMDTAAMVSALNDTLRQIEAENRTKIIKDENGVNRILIGQGPDGKYVMKVSRAGIDVLQAKDDDLIFNSSQNILKVRATGSGVFKPSDFYNNGGAHPIQASKYIPFSNYGGPWAKAPIVQVYFELPIGFVQTPYYNIDYTNGNITYYVQAVTDDNGVDIRINSQNSFGSQNIPFKFYIYQESTE